MDHKNFKTNLNSLEAEIEKYKKLYTELLSASSTIEKKRLVLLTELTKLLREHRKLMHDFEIMKQPKNYKNISYQKKNQIDNNPIIIITGTTGTTGTTGITGITGTINMADYLTDSSDSSSDSDISTDTNYDTDTETNSSGSGSDNKICYYDKFIKREFIRQKKLNPNRTIQEYQKLCNNKWREKNTSEGNII